MAMKKGWTLIAVGALFGYWFRPDGVSVLFFGVVPVFIGLLVVLRAKSQTRQVPTQANQG